MITDNQMIIMRTLIRLIKSGGFWREYSGYELNIPRPGDVHITFYDGRRISILPDGNCHWVPGQSPTTTKQESDR